MGNISEQFDFHLPSDLIAQDPAKRRGDSRLLLVEPRQGISGELVFRDLPSVLRSGDLLVMNQSRVLPARLFTRRADTGGKVEILLIRPAETERTWIAMARPTRRLKPGTRLEILPGPLSRTVTPDDSPPSLEVVEKRDDGMILVHGPVDPADLAEAWGSMPLPPYIRREDSGPEGIRRAGRDLERYQTVFAKSEKSKAGSVAAPTAGLHFSASSLVELAELGVRTAHLTLHIGPGTFQPPSPAQLQSGRLHREDFHLPAETLSAVAETRASGGRVIAVGTTSLRVLETASRLDLDGYTINGALPAGAEPVDCTGEELNFPGDGREAPFSFCGRAVRRNGAWELTGHTRLFIRPPDRVTAVDGLLTNFHLPGSSLLMLVASLMGPETWLPVYRYAVENRLRFYSYGDCMLILPGLERS
ncbi:MAG: S-adenosylmethionine:tRNA ribosyltransferase-isomerase [Gemmatimonadales bacterium]|nr:S-adenosylmethionine:tRNA ribosyltransferase-isomerase [Gemmatimonadales bacterium]